MHAICWLLEPKILVVKEINPLIPLIKVIHEATTQTSGGYRVMSFYDMLETHKEMIIKSKKSYRQSEITIYDYFQKINPQLVDICDQIESKLLFIW